MEEKIMDAIGVVFTGSDSDGGLWARIDADGNVVPDPGQAFFDTHPVWGGIKDVVIDGQYMVLIPAFYIKRTWLTAGEYAGKHAWLISDKPLDGFSIHPAFRRDGGDLQQVFVGKYQASMDGSKLSSVPGVKPAVSRSLTQFQADAAARNEGDVDGFMLWSAYQWSAIQWLYLVENATMDSQSKTGRGRVDAWGKGAAEVDAEDVAQATYRGIVGLWGNVWQWIDGLKTDDGEICLWDRHGRKTWVETGQIPDSIDDAVYPVTFMDERTNEYDLGDLFIVDFGADEQSESTAPDWQYWDSYREAFPIVGGHWSYGAHAGLWNVNCVPAASISHSILGARLAKE
ncbi:phage-related hypothetical protein [Alkalidesulfovibrio alkalitolerans DSM 16529]|uniref:Sulphatase-modifying factor protein n=1 Tax=Alkalidesulfovibrio alkalitolerans DSM 16529 TaxID=1121439 RepID=S7TEE7_9BACT|nr:hypothetical protein [Alkalidesulfovibrio alkalitolerans]EPR35577.1 phage-related hypothetical protein [Alkalidesulfovibrio alkalitolerans DSM 16529]